MSHVWRVVQFYLCARSHRFDSENDSTEGGPLQLFQNQVTVVMYRVSIFYLYAVGFFHSTCMIWPGIAWYGWGLFNVRFLMQMKIHRRKKSTTRTLWRLEMSMRKCSLKHPTSASHQHRHIYWMVKGDRIYCRICFGEIFLDCMPEIALKSSWIFCRWTSSMGHSNSLVGLELTSIQDPRASSWFSLRLLTNTLHILN